jgi:16S rRNA (adenine1518-N6/adenine1519-N6)-dimethyltransferase
MKHLARKRFGQNFLIDQAVVGQIIAAIAPVSGDLVVEIGPGLGALTEPLLAALGPGALHVIELDRDLARRLRETRWDPGSSSKEGKAPPLFVHEADALTFDFSRLAAPGQRLRLVGNLPYNISSPLLFHLRQFADLVRDQHFMLQREVVERMVAAPGNSAYGRLSVMLQVCYAMETLFEVPPEAFDPAPKVYSAVVRITPLGLRAPRIQDVNGFTDLVRQAFSQRRKMLRNTLAPYELVLPMRDYGLDPSARAETIAPERYVDYANALAQLAPEVTAEPSTSD